MSITPEGLCAGASAVLTVAATLAAGLGVKRLVDATSRRNLLPVTPIGHLRPGERVRVVGKVRVHEPQEEVLPGARTVAWSVSIHTPRAQGNGPPEVLAKEDHRTPFWVEEPTGRVFVDPHGAALLATNDLILGRDRPGVDRTTDRLAVLDRFVPDVDRRRRAVVRYGSLGDGETVSVTGIVDIVEVDGAPTLALRGDDAHRLMITDQVSIIERDAHLPKGPGLF